MIVISGALVLVALVLLVIGVVQQTLPFVYASIGVSLVSLVFLVVGILQRRGDTAPAAEAGTPEAAPSSADASEVTAVIPSQGSRRVPAAAAAAAVGDEPAEAPVDDDFDEELDSGGTVLVVAGRPRYHVDGCRYLAGKTAEEVDVLDAREEGFTACGVCKPDDALAAADAAADRAPAGAQRDDADVVEEDVPGVEVAPARRSAAGGTRAVKAPAAKAPSKAAPARAATSAASKAPAKSPAKTPAKAAVTPAKAAKAAPAKSAAARKAPATTVAADASAAAPAKAVKAPGRAAAVKAPSRAAAAASAGPTATAAKRAGSVVVIPDRGKFHTAQCRFVRGVEGTEVLSKTAASRQGYTACGVCKP